MLFMKRTTKMGYLTLGFEPETLQMEVELCATEITSVLLSPCKQVRKCILNIKIVVH
jgi:hypothetical protein